MTSLGMLVIVCVVIVLLVPVWLTVTYNGLVRRRNQVDNAWAQVDVQLTRRYDLIPNLVETVKAYAAHERGTFEAVVRAREAAVAASGPADKERAEAVLRTGLTGLLALAEAYPALRASGNFDSLQRELATAEDRAAYARQYYNDAVLAYNTSVASFPTLLVAGPLGFRARAFFAAAEGETGPVQVRF
ncbi:LemA family protein [Streptomyces sp. NPDC002812]|uniref:LemA family protein n=1 Tax=unclassified Streptomyces TaxID=2593676 RepID=UPI00332C6217